jgi:hypothetical protein
MPDCHDLQDHARVQVRVGQRVLEPRSADRTVAAVLTTTAWLLSQLPHRVRQAQRAELVRTLAQATSLTVEVAVGPEPAVRIKDGTRLLVEIPARP